MKALVVFGGRSFEHDISIITAVQTIKNSKDCSFDLLPVYVSKNEEWFLFLGDKLEVRLFHDFEKNYKKNGFVKAHLCLGQNILCYKKGIAHKKVKIDACLNCCHGGAGEDGSLAAALFMSKIPVSSYSLAGMSVCMDKVLSKAFFKEAGTPVIDYFAISKNDLKDEENIKQKLEKLKYPVILKPSRLGSSIGISIANNFEEFSEKIDLALLFDQKVLVEKALIDDFKEYNVACMRTASGEVLASEVDQPAHTKEILSFEDKYIGSPSGGGAKKGKGAAYLKKKKFPKIDDGTRLQLQELSKKIYAGLDMLGVVRIDFIEHKRKIYVNEVNTVPGSLAYYFFVPSFFKTCGKFVDELLNAAITYQDSQANIQKEFITKLI